MVKLGKRYKDSLTGFEGVATARTEYLFGCVRVALETAKDNDPKDAWFDEQRLVDAEAKPVETNASSGGPQAAPPSRDPQR